MITKKQTIVELWNKCYHMQNNDNDRIAHIHLVTGVDRDTIRNVLENENG